MTTTRTNSGDTTRATDSGDTTRAGTRSGPAAMLRSIIAPHAVVHAHCDLPCGIYDPEQARIEAESCFKIMQKMQDNADPSFRTRAIDIKEQRAELVKHHLDVLWHDYFKPEHESKVPELHQLFWKATKQASTVKASTDPEDGKQLLELIDQVDEAWRVTGGPAKTRVNGRRAAPITV